jgi:hypothetical protein
MTETNREQIAVVVEMVLGGGTKAGVRLLPLVERTICSMEGISSTDGCVET